MNPPPAAKRLSFLEAGAHVRALSYPSADYQQHYFITARPTCSAGPIPHVTLLHNLPPECVLFLPGGHLPPIPSIAAAGVLVTLPSGGIWEQDRCRLGQGLLGPCQGLACAVEALRADPVSRRHRVAPEGRTMGRPSANATPSRTRRTAAFAPGREAMHSLRGRGSQQAAVSGRR
jgi:hypothetical protein